MAKPGNSGFKRIFRAAGYSMQGFRAAWQHEAAFRQELALVAVLIPLGAWLGDTAIERALLIGVCLLVLIVELLNSAVEAAIDRHGDEHHELSGRAKDFGSAAVFVVLVLVTVTWALILLPKYIH